MIPDVVVYFSSLQKQTPSRKIDVLRCFAEGARNQGARVIIQPKYELIPSKLAVILGWPSPLQQGANIKLRAAVVDQQKQNGGHVMAIDASTFKFHDPEGKYLRYSLNGVFYDSSEYANRGSDARRWLQISGDLGLTMRPWKTQGEYILLLMQRDGGWSMKGLNPISWVEQKCAEIRQITNMPIRVRPHPGKKIDLSPLRHLGVELSDSRQCSLTEDLEQARAACVFNSSSGVASILHGVPLIVDDASSVCWQVSNHDITGVIHSQLPERSQWIWDLAAAHWSDEESSQGQVFDKFIPYMR